MLMLHHPGSPDYYSSAASAQGLSSGIISSPLEKMPLELLRSTHQSGALDEELSPTDCSEDSVEIRSPRPISNGVVRPSAILATPSSLKRSSNRNWMDSEQPEEKRMRRGCIESNYAGLSVPPPLTPFYPGPASLSALKLAASSTPHDLTLLLEADRNRLLHHWLSAGRLDDVPSWMRTNWPLVPPVPSSDAAAHLMTSALHYYPHLIQSNYNLPPQSPMPLTHHPFLHPPPPMYLSAAYGLPLYHRPILTGHDPSAPSRLDEKIQPPVLSPVRAGSVTPTAALPPPQPLPPTPEKEASARLVPASSVVDPSDKKSLSGRRSSSAVSQVRMKKQRKLPADGIQPEKATKTKSSSSSGGGGGFLSVETLLGRETRSEIVEPEEEDAEASWTPRPAFREQPHLPGQVMNNSAITNRNYKNMTRERRMQANARERTRVHTISAAFEALRRAVPSFSHGQRLSKLSILRVASAYIAALGQLADDEPADEANLSECVDRCTRTLMTEGQMLRRKRSGQPQQPNSGEPNGTDDDDDDD